MNGLRLYGRYVRTSVRAQMQYRASFVMQALAQFLVTGFELLAIWALFDRFESLQGWVFAEVAVFYGMISTSFAVNDALTRGFDVAGRLIKQGDMDRLFLRQIAERTDIDPEAGVEIVVGFGELGHRHDWRSRMLLDIALELLVLVLHPPQVFLVLGNGGEVPVGRLGHGNPYGGVAIGIGGFVVGCQTRTAQQQDQRQQN